MQRQDERKRTAILDAASDHFAKRLYHEVRLDDIAAAAGVGKGTLYVYFDGKDRLFEAMITAGLDTLLAELRAAAAAPGAAWPVLAALVRQLSAYVVRHPEVFELMRSNPTPEIARAVRRRRREMGRCFERVLRRGVESGEFADPDPALTAQFIPAMARSGVVWSTRRPTAETLSEHILRTLRHGIRPRRHR